MLKYNDLSARVMDTMSTTIPRSSALSMRDIDTISTGIPRSSALSVANLYFMVMITP